VGKHNQTGNLHDGRDQVKLMEGGDRIEKTGGGGLKLMTHLGAARGSQGNMLTSATSRFQHRENAKKKKQKTMAEEEER